MSDSNEPADATPPEKPPRWTPVLMALSPPASNPPRLGIIHVMLWMAGTGLLLALSRVSLNQDALPANGDLSARMLIACWCIILGPSVASLMIYCACTLRQRYWPLDPGEVLLLTLGASAILDLLAFLTLQSTAFFPDSEFVYMVILFLAVVRAVIYIAVYFQMKSTSLWRFFFALNGLSMIGCCILGPFPLREVFNPLTHLVLITSLCFDHIHAYRRNWLHWIGVMSYFALGAFYWIVFGWRVSGWKLFDIASWVN